MPKYLFSWDETTTLNVVIEADTIHQAYFKFDNLEFDFEDVHEASVQFSDGPYCEEV